MSVFICLGCTEMLKIFKNENRSCPRCQPTSLGVKKKKKESLFSLSLFLYFCPFFSPASSPIVDHFALRLSPFLSRIHQLAACTAAELYYSEGPRCLCAGMLPCTPAPPLLSVGPLCALIKPPSKLLPGGCVYVCCTLQQCEWVGCCRATSPKFSPSLVMGARLHQ